MKCEICKSRIGETFLKKVLGTYISDKAGKKHLVCFECQKRFKLKEALLKELGV